MLFLAVDGFAVGYGLTTPNQLEARVNRATAEAARRTIVVCNSSKFGRRSLSLIMPVSAVHETITDRGVLRHDLRSLREAEIEVTLV
jgi:DeoR family transcriptional regulator of aga operon